jgi:hypothetical protein
MLPATVTCLVARQGTELLGEIENAVRQGDFTSLKDLSDAILDQMTAVLTNPEPIFRNMSEIPVLLEIRYGGRILSQGIFVADSLPVATASVLYNGGPLSHDQFRVVEYFRSEAERPHQVLILINKPELTALEQAILDRVPDDKSEVFVSMPGVGWPAVLGRVAVEAARYLAVAAGEYVLERGFDYVWDWAADALRDDVAADERAAEADAADERMAEADAAEADAADERAADAEAAEADAADERMAEADAADDAEADAAAEDDAGEEYYVVYADDEADAGDDAAVDDAGADAEGEALDPYLSSLRRHDFSNLDPTASAQALLKLRMRLLTRRRRR